ncbi:hypothetical protein, partial [Companilactobacillus zhongbaensis]|uniref:hypothetical protein n=1 Tax=Companilactobacillus zhongbaensis TaxID=2486009 RepID=UPI0013DE6DE4
MKKNIKYAGIAAATLLMVAPLAAPVFSTTSTAKAADDSTTTDTSKLDDATQAALTRVLGTLQSSTTYSGKLDFSDVKAVYGQTDLTALPTTTTSSDTPSATTEGTDGTGDTAAAPTETPKATSIFGLASIAKAATSTPLAGDPTTLDKAVTFGVQGVKDGTVLTNASDFGVYIGNAAKSSITLRVTAYLK